MSKVLSWWDSFKFRNDIQELKARLRENFKVYNAEETRVELAVKEF